MRPEGSRHRRLWPWLLSAFGLAVAGCVMLVSAVATASLRFGECGSSHLGASDPYCRVGARLLLMSYGVLSLALVLATIALWLRARRKP
jgi:hypothetical protein